MDLGNIGDPGLNPNNPFYFDVVGAAAVPPMQQQPAARERAVRLPEFWPHAPQIWFARAELQFEVHNVSDERQRFAYAANALSYDTVRLVADLITVPPLVSPYTVLKERLLLSTQLTPVQQAEKILDFALLGDRRPSQLLAEMFEYCPRGEEHTAFFRASFLRRLPADIRVLLHGLDNEPLKDLAVRADQLWLTRPPGGAAAVAAVSQDNGGGAFLDEDLIAAVSKPGNRGGWRGKGGRGTAKPGYNKQSFSTGGGQRDGSGGNSGKGQRGTQQVSVCWRHRKFGDQAWDCADQAACQFANLGN